jgi:hypothetical protein
MRYPGQNHSCKSRHTCFLYLTPPYPSRIIGDCPQIIEEPSPRQEAQFEKSFQELKQSIERARDQLKPMKFSKTEYRGSTLKTDVGLVFRGVATEALLDGVSWKSVRHDGSSNPDLGSNSDSESDLVSVFPDGTVLAIVG